MIKRSGALLAGILIILVFSSIFAKESAPRGVHWPMFRGPASSGISEGYPTPVQWNVETSQNVLWKTPIPGLAHSSPVIWGDSVFVTTAIGGQEKPLLRVGLYGDIRPVEDDSVHRWIVYCIDKRTGKVRWQQTAHEGVPKIKRHTKSTHANPTIATDGKHVVAFFGSEGLYCYDMKGKLLWKKDLGVLDSGFFMVPSAQWGFSSSPVIHDSTLYLQCDVQKDSFVGAFDLKDGRELWRTPRADVPTFGTPAVHPIGNRLQLIVNGYKHVGGYDAKTGKELWKLVGGGDIPVPTPIVAHDLIFVTNAHGRIAPIYAIRPDASGDISLQADQSTNSHVAWSQNREGAYMQTPLVYGDYLYNCRDNGVLSCYDAKTGTRVYQVRLADGRTGFSASAVGGDGKLYYTSEDGEVYVVKAGAQFEQISKNPLGEVCMATPAMSEGKLYFRTQGHLIAIGGRK